MKSILPLGAALLMLSAPLAACGSRQAPKAAPPAVLAATVMASSERQAMFVGRISSLGAHDVAAQTDGRLVRLLVNVGDHVRAGQVLAVLDGETQRLQGAQAGAELNAAEVVLAGAQRDADRLQALVDAGAAARQDLDAARVRLDQARQQRAGAAAQAALAARDTRRTEIRAPADGVITAREASLSSLVTAGAVLFRMDAGGAREIVATVPSGLAASLPRGGSVRFAFGSATGTAALVGVSARVEGVDALTARFRVTSGEAPAGAAVEVWAPQQGETPDDVLAPLSAVLTNKQGGKYVLKITPEGRLAAASVTVTEVTSAGARLRGAIRPGDQLVAVGGQHVRAGQQVRPLPYTA